MTTFANIPDAALSGFRLQLRGGKHGILVVTGDRNLCRGKQVAAVQTDGQNGKTGDFSVAMKAPCVSAKTRARASAKKRSWGWARARARGSRWCAVGRRPKRPAPHSCALQD